MRLRWLVVLPCAAAAIVAAALLLRQAPESEATPVEPPVVAEPAPDSPSADTEALELDGDVISVHESSSRESLAAKVEPQIEAQSPPVQLHGTLIDENTRLPLPDFELEFAVAGEGEGLHRSVSARTDAQGRFQCAEPILVARCVVRYVDRPGRRRPPPEATIELEDVRKGELALVVAWGATYRLAFAPKERIEPALVDLRQRTPGGRDRGAGPNEWEPVRAGEPPWVRFPPLGKDAPKVERLTARTRDGLWAGEADAGTANGLAPGLTLVTFEERAVLDGTVRDAEKRLLADVDVVLEAKDSNEQPLRRNARTGVDGHFRFEHLPACTGQVRAVSVRHAPWVQAVTLLAGKVQELPIELAGLAIAGAIGVRVESESGHYAPPFTLVLSLENDPVAEAGGERFTRPVRAQWREEGGRQVASFSFPDLPKQSFRVAIQKDDFFAWDPQQLTLQPPKEDARILIHDGIPNASLCFRAKDAQTGEALQGFEVTLEFPGTRLQSRRMGASSDRPFLEHLPLDRKLSWRVEAGGHVPALGDLSDFQVVEVRAEGELRVCELSLPPGWGESYRFVDSRNRSPMKGMRVLLDGVEAGTSNAGGRVLVQAATRPGRIEYKNDELGIAPRSVRADRRTGCSTEVRVDPGKPARGKR